jgi:hypothetical protein
MLLPVRQITGPFGGRKKYLFAQERPSSATSLARGARFVKKLTLEAVQEGQKADGCIASCQQKGGSEGKTQT